MNSIYLEKDIANLVMILNAKTTPPKAMAASFSPLLGTYCVIMGMLSSLKNVKAGVSQNDGPIHAS